MSLFKLDNVIQNYAWGSKDSIHNLFGINNPEHKPQAEIWMGAHPNGCSRLDGTGEPLAEVIEHNKQDILGGYTAARFGELPFLFKVLAAETPLSIQVHPSKHKAQQGFERENQQGIPLDAAHRNYKDSNHKPELVYALTFYKAMNGFRPIADIITLFKEADIPSLAKEISELEKHADSAALQEFFAAIMSLEGERKKVALAELGEAHRRPAKTMIGREALQYSAEFKRHYPGDIGLFSPLMLNTVELAPGEAMFLYAETPHAYVQGTGLEIMANSDNVLRAGLTPKHIDVTELIDNTSFEPIEPAEIRLKPIYKEGNKVSYPIPVDDFCFEVMTVEITSQAQFVRSAEILFCIEGEVAISSQNNHVVLRAGESVFVSSNSVKYDYQGHGRIARAFN